MKRLFAYAAAAAVCAAAAPLAACTPQGGEDISSYTINATYDGGNTLEGSVQLNYFNDTQNALDSLKFNLWGNAFRAGAASLPLPEQSQQAYYDGQSYGGMQVTAVSGGRWQVCGQDENILEVSLAATLYPEERVTVSIDYTLTLANVNARTGVSTGGVNLGNFYPILCAYGTGGWLEYTYSSVGDPFVSAVADYAVTLTYPRQYIAATSGREEGGSASGGQQTTHFSLKRARDFAAVLSQDFTVESTTAGGVQVYYYHHGDPNAQTVLAAAARSLQYFGDTFGSYPYPTYSVVQTGFYQGGMEYPALSMLSSSCDGQTAIYTTVHETAHQWWYAVVGSDQYQNSWQDEGLAEYSTLMFFESNPDYGFTPAGLQGSATKAYRAYFSVYGQLFGGVDTSMTRPLSAFSGVYEYANIAYNKGLLLFCALREACGQANFVAALGAYYGQYAFAIAPPEGLAAAFCRHAGCEGIFQSFLQGNVII